jgi:sugar diacid utilization regulator
LNEKSNSDRYHNRIGITAASINQHIGRLIASKKDNMSLEIESTRATELSNTKEHSNYIIFLMRKFIQAVGISGAIGWLKCFSLIIKGRRI